MIDKKHHRQLWWLLPDTTLMPFWPCSGYKKYKSKWWKYFCWKVKCQDLSPVLGWKFSLICWTLDKCLTCVDFQCSYINSQMCSSHSQRISFWPSMIYKCLYNKKRFKMILKKIQSHKGLFWCPLPSICCFLCSAVISYWFRFWF